MLLGIDKVLEWWELQTMCIHFTIQKPVTKNGRTQRQYDTFASSQNKFKGDEHTKDDAKVYLLSILNTIHGEKLVLKVFKSSASPNVTAQTDFCIGHEGSIKKDVQVSQISGITNSEFIKISLEKSKLELEAEYKNKEYERQLLELKNEIKNSQQVMQIEPVKPTINEQIFNKIEPHIDGIIDSLISKFITKDYVSNIGNTEGNDDLIEELNNEKQEDFLHYGFKLEKVLNKSGISYANAVDKIISLIDANPQIVNYLKQ